MRLVDNAILELPRDQAIEAVQVFPGRESGGTSNLEYLMIFQERSWPKAPRFGIQVCQGSCNARRIVRASRLEQMLG